MRGAGSPILPAGHAREMAARRPNTKLVELPGGHVIHDDSPAEFAGTVIGFLKGIGSGS